VSEGGYGIIFGDTLSGCSNPMTSQILVEISNDGYVFWYDILTIVVTDIEGSKLKLPKTFALQQNYPNPFNPSTTIEFDILISSEVIIYVYNIAGQKIRTLLNKKMPAGNHQVKFNAGNLSTGIYFYRIEAGDFQEVKKMILIK
jgi:hypothetical protein